MSTVAFSLILISGVMHALWNLLVKQSRHKTVFIWWMFVSSSILFSMVMPLTPGNFPLPDLQVLLLVGAGASCFVLYHLFNGRAHRLGDLSLTYPLSQTAMIYVPLWGIIFLHERLTATGASGILLIAAGACGVQMQRLTIRELLRPFSNLGDPAARAALAAGFIYSMGAIVDKIGVSSYSPLHFTYLLVIAMLLLMTLNILRPCYRQQIVEEIRSHPLLILASGPIMMGSFLTFRYGLSLAPMSYAIPTRQVSILVGVLLGIFLLGEPWGRSRLTGALLILLGAVLIRLG
jgi:drug/metabolite transporter (DMT)-like permease